MSPQTQQLEVRVYLPAPGRAALSHVLGGSAIVSHHDPAPAESGMADVGLDQPDRLVVYYEGNKYGAG